MLFDIEKIIGRRVQVYWNGSKQKLEIIERHTGKTLSLSDYVMLQDVMFAVCCTCYYRCRMDGRETAHGWAEGTVINGKSLITPSLEVRYSPSQYDYFRLVGSNERIDYAPQAYITHKRIFINRCSPDHVIRENPEESSPATEGNPIPSIEDLVKKLKDRLQDTRFKSEKKHILECIAIATGRSVLELAEEYSIAYD